MEEQINNKRTIKDIIKVAFSNAIVLLSGVLVGFLIPKIIGIEDYGYYKTFTLYSSYVGLFHFGIQDGIYLKYGGQNFDELDRKKFNFYTRFLIILEAVLSIIAVMVSLFFLSGELKFIFLCLAIYLFCFNTMGYFQMISQITRRFNELSIRNVIQAILTIVSLVSLWLINHFNNYDISYRLYTIIFLSIQSVLMLWYIFTYRSITFGKQSSYRESGKDIKEFVKIGFPLLVSNLCLILILNIDRQFVNILFENSTYAIYAFAYNMLSLITVATAAISTVIYPTMKKANEEKLKEVYTKLISIIVVFVFMCLLVYYPLCIFINWFLPKYVDSIIIFRVILPGLVLSSAISIVMHNYYKILGKNYRFFIISIIILALSIGANVVAYLLFRTPIAISVASIFVLLIWYFIVQHYFVKNYKIKWVKNFLYIIIMMASFYGVTFIKNNYLGFGVHVAVTLAITYLFFYKTINAFFKKKFSRKEKESM